MCRRAKEEFLHPCLAVRKTISEKAQAGHVGAVRQHRMMCLRIERIVDRNAFAGAGRLVAADHGITAAIREHKIVSRHLRMEGIGWILR